MCVYTVSILKMLWVHQSRPGAHVGIHLKPGVCFCVPQGVVTAATSLISTLAQKNPEEFKTSVSLAVSRLSRVSVVGRTSGGLRLHGLIQ